MQQQRTGRCPGSSKNQVGAEQPQLNNTCSQLRAHGLPELGVCHRCRRAQRWAPAQGRQRQVLAGKLVQHGLPAAQSAAACWDYSYLS